MPIFQRTQTQNQVQTQETSLLEPKLHLSWVSIFQFHCISHYLIERNKNNKKKRHFEKAPLNLMMLKPSLSSLHE